MKLFKYLLSTSGNKLHKYYSSIYESCWYRIIKYWHRKRSSSKDGTKNKSKKRTQALLVNPWTRHRSCCSRRSIAASAFACCACLEHAEIQNLPYRIHPSQSKLTAQRLHRLSSHRHRTTIITVIVRHHVPNTSQQGSGMFRRLVRLRSQRVQHSEAAATLPQIVVGPRLTAERIVEYEATNRSDGHRQRNDIRRGNGR